MMAQVASSLVERWRPGTDQSGGRAGVSSERGKCAQDG
jgi:hypothetical protein